MTPQLQTLIIFLLGLGIASAREFNAGSGISVSLTYSFTHTMPLSDVFIGIPVTFHAPTDAGSGSMFAFDTGDTTEGFGEFGSSNMLNHTYSFPGEYVARVMVKSGTSISVGISRISVIDSKNRCYVYCVSNMGKTSFDVQVCDPRGVTKSNELTSAFIALGEVPIVSFRGASTATVSDPFSVAASSSSWKVSFQLNNYDQDVFDISSKGTIVTGCGVFDSHFVVSKSAISSIPSHLQHQHEITALQLNSTFPTLNFFPAVCSSGRGVLLINNTMLYKTEDSGEHVDHLQANLDVDEKINDIRLFRYGTDSMSMSMIIQTNNRLLRWVYETGSGSGMTEINVPMTSFVNGKVLRIFGGGGSTTCPSNSNVQVNDIAYVVFGNQTHQSLVYSSSGDFSLSSSSWETIVTVGEGKIIRDVVWCVEQELSVVLIDNYLVSFNHSLSKLVDGVQFVFPSSASIRGIHAHAASPCSIVAYGNGNGNDVQIWSSVNGPYHFNRLLPVSTTNHTNSIAHVCSSVDGGFAALSSSGAVIWGRLGVTHMVEVVPSTSLSVNMNMKTIILDDAGDLHTVAYLHNNNSSNGSLHHFKLPLYSRVRAASFSRASLDTPYLGVQIVKNGYLRFKSFGNEFDFYHNNLVVGDWRLTLPSISNSVIDATSNVASIQFNSGNGDGNGKPALRVEGTSSKAILTLTLTPDSSSNNDTVWTQAHVGQCLIMVNVQPGSESLKPSDMVSIIIDQVANDTVAFGRVVFGFEAMPSSTSASISTLQWTVLDYRSVKNGNVASDSQILTVSETSAILSINQNAQNVGAFRFSWNSSHIGSLLSLTDTNTWCVVHTVVNATTALVAWRSIQASQYRQYASREWGVYWPDEGDGGRLLGSWGFDLGKCPYSYSNVARAQLNGLAFVGGQTNVMYLDTNDRVAISSSSSSDTQFFFSNPVVVDYTVSDASSLTVMGSQFGKMSSVSMQPAHLSLKCPPSIASWTKISLINGCPISKKLYYNSDKDGLTAADFGPTGDPRFPDGASRIEMIPVNYRPPSALGVGIPLSARFYNANPAAPKYRNDYVVSQNSGKFMNTVCTGALTFMYNETECMKKVLRVYYGTSSLFVPKLEITLNGVVLDDPIEYSLIELNGRTDWCTNATLVCANRTIVEQTHMWTNQSHGIMWSGPELYHFRATVHSDSVCKLHTDFAVWVFQPPNDETIVWSYSIITSVGMALFLLLAFVIFARRADEVEFEGVQ